jgi:hypothetical protein
MRKLTLLSILLSCSAFGSTILSYQTIPATTGLVENNFDVIAGGTVLIPVALFESGADVIGGTQNGLQSITAHVGQTGTLPSDPATVTGFSSTGVFSASQFFLQNGGAGADFGSSIIGSSGPFGPGAIEFGELSIQAGAVAGQVTTFQIRAENNADLAAGGPGPGNTYTFGNGVVKLNLDLDNNWASGRDAIYSGAADLESQFSVTTVETPASEPGTAMLMILFAVPAVVFGIRAARRKKSTGE